MNFCKDCKYCKIPHPKFIWFFITTMRVCHHPKYKYVNYVTGDVEYKDEFCDVLRMAKGSECSNFEEKD